MEQNQINHLAALHTLSASKQHQGSDGRYRFFLTSDITPTRYLQGAISYGHALGGDYEIQAHVGLYADRKVADDGIVTDYQTVGEAINDVAKRFNRLRGH